MKNKSISRILALAKTSGRRKAMALLFGFATLALAVGGMSSTAGAQTKLGENGSTPTCNLQTLKGRYLFAWSGAVLPPAFGVTEQTLSGAAGYNTFNGDGTGTATVTVRIGATIAARRIVISPPPDRRPRVPACGPDGRSRASAPGAGRASARAGQQLHTRSQSRRRQHDPG